SASAAGGMRGEPSACELAYRQFASANARPWMAGPDGSEDAALRHGRHEGTSEASRPPGLPNARPWMAGPDGSERWMSRHGWHNAAVRRQHRRVTRRKPGHGMDWRDGAERLGVSPRKAPKATRRPETSRPTRLIRSRPPSHTPRPLPSRTHTVRLRPPS